MTATTQGVNVTVTYGGPQGQAAVDAYVYIAWASDASGTDFTTTFNASLDYIAFKNSSTVIAAPSASDFTGLWKNYKGATGAAGDMAWKGEWQTATLYKVNELVYHAKTGYGQSVYICTVEHTSGASTEPEVGGSWDTDWDLYSEGGANGAGDMESDGSVAMTGALTMTQISTPSAPAASKTAIYPKSDGKIYRFSNGGVEQEVGCGMWTNMPAAPTRVSDTSFSLPDASNANSYDKMFDPGTVIRWEKSGGGNQFAVITDAAYNTNVVTYTILGNTLAAGFSTMKYCIHKAMQEINIMPGTNPRAAETGVGKTILLPYDIYVFGARIRYGTAPTTTKGVWDINDDGTTIFTTKPEIAASATKGSWQVSDSLLSTALTAVAADSLITTDYDSGHATTPGADAYVMLLFMPVAWRYRA